MIDVLVAVDLQNDFIDGALGTKEAVAIVEKAKERIESFPGIVLFTRDTHSDNYMESEEGKNLPVPHCIKGSKGWEIREELEKQRDNLLSGLNSKVNTDRLKAEGYMVEIRTFMEKRMAEYSHKLETMKLLLEENNPAAVLKKGYGILEDMSGKVISSVKDIKEGGRYLLSLKDGCAVFTIRDFNSEEKL